MKNLLWLDDIRNPHINEEGKVPTRKNGKQLKCVWCGNDESKDILPQLCNECFKKGCKAF